MTTEERDARLILASLTTPRGAGRAALLKLAEKGDDTALDVLEMTPRERQIALVRGKLSPKVTSLFSADPVYQAANEKRRKRKLGIPQVLHKGMGRLAGWTSWSRPHWDREDPLKERKPGQSLERFVLEIFDRSLRRAGFRHASAGHETKIEYVSPGQAGVKEESTSIRPKGSGWWRLKSIHHWRVSSEILKVPATRDDGSRFDGKYLWLTPALRVKQGRGTSLVVERQRGGKWEPSKAAGEWIEGQGWKANWR